MSDFDCLEWFIALAVIAENLASILACLLKADVYPLGLIAVALLPNKLVKW